MRDYALKSGPKHGGVKTQDFVDTMEFHIDNTLSSASRNFWLASETTMNFFAGSRGSSIYQWNKIFREIGVDGVVDSYGIIHAGEPKQAVFFSTKVITDKELYFNKYSKMEINHSKSKKDWFTGEIPNSVKAEYMASARNSPTDDNPLTRYQAYDMIQKESIKNKEDIFNEMVNNFNSGDPFSNSATIMRFMAIAGTLSNNTVRIVLNNKKLFTDADLMSCLYILDDIYPSHNKNISTTLIYAILKRVIDANLLKQPTNRRYFNGWHHSLMRMNAASVGQSSAKKAVKEQLATLFAQANP